MRAAAWVGAILLVASAEAGCGRKVASRQSAAAPPPRSHGAAASRTPLRRGKRVRPAIAPNRLSPDLARALEDSDADPFWRAARRATGLAAGRRAAAAEAALHGVAARATALVPLAIDFPRSGEGAPRRVALTFDDGPHPEYTPKLLAILARYRARATFFVVGEMAERYPELVRAEAAAGHAIGNHTYHHVSLRRLPAESVAAEIEACGRVIRWATGEAPHLFRPPGGGYNGRVVRIAAGLGYTTVLWSANSGDEAVPQERTIASRVLRRAHSGAVLLFHDGVPATLAALPRILSRLQKEGYGFVTVDELLRERSRLALRSARPHASPLMGGPRAPAGRSHGRLPAGWTARRRLADT